MVYLHFVRSPYAHAKIVSVDTSAAEGLAGVICTLTGAEIARQTQPFIEIGPEPFAKIEDYPMAVSKVCYQGEPVAAVVAESPAIADDAAELIQVNTSHSKLWLTQSTRSKIKVFFTKKRERIAFGAVCSNMATSRKNSKTQRTSSTSTAFIFIASRAHLLRTTSSSPRGILKMNASITPATIRSPHSRFSFSRRI